jgi:hypothetical protein
MVGIGAAARMTWALVTGREPAVSGGSAGVDVGDAGAARRRGSAGGVGEAGEHAEGGQAAAFGAGSRGLRGVQPAGQVGLGQPGPGAQRVDQFVGCPAKVAAA